MTGDDEDEEEKASKRRHVEADNATAAVEKATDSDDKKYVSTLL